MKPKYTYDRTSLITNFIKMAKCILADGGKNERMSRQKFKSKGGIN